MRKSSSTVYADSRIKDDTVPYPSAAIDTVDHFTEWQDQGIEVESDSDGIMSSWRRVQELRKPVKKGWASKLGTLPPVLKYRFPYNYVRLSHHGQGKGLMKDDHAVHADYGPLDYDPHVRLSHQVD